MRVSMIQEMQEVLPPPTYVFQKSGETVYVDKVEIDGKKVMRKRYVLTAGQQCTCMGFMKTGNCKHLRMLRGDPPEKCVGVLPLTAVELVHQMMEALHAKKLVAEVPKIDESCTTADAVRSVTVTVKKRVLGLYKLVCQRKIEGQGELEIVLVFDDESKTE